MLYKLSGPMQILSGPFLILHLFFPIEDLWIDLMPITAVNLASLWHVFKFNPTNMVLLRPLLFVLVSFLDQSESRLLTKCQRTGNLSCCWLVDCFRPALYMRVLPSIEEGGDILMAVRSTTKCKKSGLSTIYRLLQAPVR